MSIKLNLVERKTRECVFSGFCVACTVTHGVGKWTEQCHNGCRHLELLFVIHYNENNSKLEFQE